MRELSPQAVAGEAGPTGSPGAWCWPAAFRRRARSRPSASSATAIRSIKDEEPLVTRKVNRSMGRRKMVRVMVGRDSRAEAQKLCKELTALGGACLVAKN